MPTLRTNLFSASPTFVSWEDFEISLSHCHVCSTLSLTVVTVLLRRAPSTILLAGVTPRALALPSPTPAPVTLVLTLPLALPPGVAAALEAALEGPRAAAAVSPPHARLTNVAHYWFLIRLPGLGCAGRGRGECGVQASPPWAALVAPG